MLASSAPRADTRLASPAPRLVPSAPGLQVRSSPTVPNAFFFERSDGWSRLTQPGARPIQGAPRRLKAVDEVSSGSHVRKRNTPFFACSGMRP